MFGLGQNVIDFSLSEGIGPQWFLFMVSRRNLMRSIYTCNNPVCRNPCSEAVAFLAAQNRGDKFPRRMAGREWSA
jgi:hypothetical protein